MKNTIYQTGRQSISMFLLYLLSIVFVMVAGCDESSNPSGTTSSLAAPTITTHPASQTVTEGGTATLSVVVTAVTGVTFTYQWQTAAKGTASFTDVAGATSERYTTPTLAVADSGVQYRVVVTATNSLKTTKSTTSGIAILSVSPATPPEPPVITTHPASQTIAGGDSVSLSVIATAPLGATLSYQWQTAAKDATDFTNVANATSEHYTTPALAVADNGIQYRVVVRATNAAKLTNAATSDIAAISVLIPKIVWTHRDGTKRYADVPADRILLSSTLTATRADIKSVDTIPSAITSIGASAFQGCTALTSVRIPRSVTSIGESAFSDCTGLTSISLPSSITSIGAAAFKGSTSLASVRVEATTPPTAGVDMFKTTHSSLVIRVPNESAAAYRAAQGWRDYAGIIYGYDEVIAKVVWRNIDDIQESSRVPTNGVLLSTTLTAARVDIRSVDTIPSAITSIGTSAFQGCTALNAIRIPNSVTSIGANAFEGCTELTSIVVPSSVTSIGAAAFKGSTSLASVRVEATTPPTAGVDMFKTTHSSLIIRVPNESAAAYRAAQGWRDYAGIIYGYDEVIAKVVWRNIDGVRQHTDVPSNGILLGSILTTWDALQSVDTIPNTITSIGVSAFLDYAALNAIRIPNSVTSIGANAFDGCTELTSIVVPSSVTSIGAAAFKGSTSLASVRVEATTPPTAGVDMFENAHADLIIRVPNESAAAYRAAQVWRDYAGIIYGYDEVIAKIVWRNNNGIKQSSRVPANGVLLSTTLTATKTDINAVDTIPNAITSIGANAFDGCTELTSVKIPSSVTSIGAAAFKGCILLSTVRLEATTPATAGVDMFGGTNSSLEIRVPNESAAAYRAAEGWKVYAARIYGYDETIPRIGWTHTNGIQQHTDVPLDGVLKSLTLIPDKTQIQSVDDIPSIVASIGANAFKGCTSLTSIRIPSTITSIGASAFSGCTALTSVRVEATTPPTVGEDMFSNTHANLIIRVPDESVSAYRNATNWSAYESRIWGYNEKWIVWTHTDGTKRYARIPADGILRSTTLTATKTEIQSVDTIPSNITSMAENAFAVCTNLTSITIPSSITSLARQAFYACTRLTSITLPSSITSIGGGAFSNCTRLKSITLPSDLTSLGEGAFQNCDSLMSIAIPNDVTRLLASTFDGCVNLTNVTMPSQLTSIGNRGFASCKKLTTITIPSTVTSIGFGAFNRCSALASITIPSSVTTINDYAFSECSSLAQVRVEATTIPAAGTDIFSSTHSSLIIRVPDERVSNYKAATNWIIYKDRIYGHNESSIVWTHTDGTRHKASVPTSGILLSSTLTATKTDIKSVDIIPSSITSLGASAFQGCTALSSISLPTSITSMGASAFQGCTALSSISIPTSITSMGASTFQGCTALSSISIPTSITSMGASTFQGCTALVNISLPTSITSMGDSTFYNCTKLESIAIPSGLTSIGGSAFFGCIALTSITLPSSITSIGKDAFRACIALTSITLPSGLTSVGTGAFSSCKKLATITIPDGVTRLLASTFWDCANLTTVTMPSRLTSIGDLVFAECKKLTNITIPNGVTSIGLSAFNRCSALASITIPSSVTTISEYAFSECPLLTQVRVEATTPPTAGKDIFLSTHSNLMIRVPDASVSAYRKATGWSTYEARILGYNEAVIIWTDINGTKRYARVPANGILLSSTLTATKTDIKSVDTIPSTITSIGVKAFSDCSGLTSITLPERVASVGDSTFLGCSSLVSITLPKYAKNIGKSAFAGCSGLTSITIPYSMTSIGGYAFHNCSGLTSVTIGNNVSSIGEWAFAGCSGITSITIPYLVQRIGDYAFGVCSGLRSVRVEAQDPPTAAGNIFTGTHSALSITVPNGRGLVYKKAGWNTYADKITEY